MAQKKYVSLSKLSTFLDNIKEIFSPISHTHKQSEITDLIIDDEVGNTSNLVKNSAVNFALHTLKEELNDNIEAAKSYTDSEIANLVNAAPETLDTLGELATAFKENEEVVDALNDAITTKADADMVEALYKKLNSNAVLGFYCIEDVTIVVNGVSTIYPANSNVEIKLVETDVFEIIPTSNNSILALNAFPGALGTYYSWLEGVKQFSNILFDMNPEDMYSKWSQGNQGSYQVQYAQYINCIFWSDNPYVSNVAKRTNYTLYYTSQLPLCYSNIPDNTFKAFYLAFNVTSDPNWGNKAYRDSFAKATWATQVFSYYGARTIGIFGHDDPDFNIVLPKDCRGLMYAATAIENAGTFDAINTTNFGASSGSWREAFGECSSLRNLYIKNLKVSLNVSWSPLNYESIYFIISTAANTNSITISLSPYTYNLLAPSDFELATSKNINIELLTTNYTEDRRLGEIANKADAKHTHTIADMPNLQTKLDEKSNTGHNHYAQAITHGVLNIERLPTVTIAKGGTGATTVEGARTKLDVYSKAEITDLLSNTSALIVSVIDMDTNQLSHTFEEIIAAYENGQTVLLSLYNGTELLSPCFLSEDKTYIGFSNVEMEVSEDQYAYAWMNGCRIYSDGSVKIEYADLLTRSDPGIEYENKDIISALNYATTEKADKTEVLFKTEQTLTDAELTQVRKNLKFIGKDVEGQQFVVDGQTLTASPNAEIFGDYETNIAVGQWSIAEGSCTVAKGRVAHAEGAYTQALQDGCHTEGYQTIATGFWSHAEGEMTRVTSYASHAEGSYTKMPDGTTRYGTASGYASHIEGGGCYAQGSCSHAEGLATTAKGGYSHTEGRYTIAGSNNQHVEGVANIEDTAGKYIHIAGNGSFEERSNAYTLDWSGNAWYQGKIYIGGTSQDNGLEVATKTDLDDLITINDIDIICGITQ